MYEVCIRTGDVVLVMERADTIVAASNMASWYRQKGHAAFYRPVLTRVA